MDPTSKLPPTTSSSHITASLPRTSAPRPKIVTFFTQPTPIPSTFPADINHIHDISVESLPNTNSEGEPLLASEDEENDTLGPLVEPDPFLLVNLRNSRPPPRPKLVVLLFVGAFLDFFVVCFCSIMLSRPLPWHKGDQWHWVELQPDLLCIGILRVITVLGVASSLWLRELGWALGGVCGTSSLYIIFKTNDIFQHKRKTRAIHLTFLAISFIFCLIHLISYIIVTTDTRRRAALLRNESIEFQEDLSADITANDTPHNDIESGEASVPTQNDSPDDTLLLGKNVQRNYGTLNRHANGDIIIAHNTAKE